jgi:cytochrome c
LACPTKLIEPSRTIPRLFIDFSPVLAPSRLRRAQAPAVLDHSRTLPQGDGVPGQVPHCGKASRRHLWNESWRPRVQSPGALMPRTAISGLVCTTFLVLLGFPAVPQEPAAKGADTESGQQTFNNACRTCHTTKEGDNRLGPNLHNIIGRKAGSLQNYGYSSAMKGADFVWDKEKLDRFIAKPDEVVPGNNMKPYGGLTSAEDRAKVIVFLESPTAN